MGAVQLIRSLEIFKDLNAGILSIVGETPKNVFPGFTPKWYMSTGNVICLFLFTNSFLENLNKIKIYLKIELTRCLDRTFKR